VFANVAFSIATILTSNSGEYIRSMIQHNPSQSHSYMVGIRFSGEKLEPLDISKRLNLQPSHLFQPQKNSHFLKKRQAFWGYNGQGEIGFQNEWTSLEEGLQFLLNVLKSRKTEIISIAHQFEGCWWCGHFQTSFDGGPTLSPKLLNEISSYNIPLYIDNYWNEE
jgi:Domain of unknown function (DUF4279)